MKTRTIRGLLGGAMGAALLFTSATAPASTDVEVLLQGTVHQALFDIAFVGQTGLAVGADGEIQTSSDGGKTWKRDKLDTDLALLGLDMDPGRTLVVGQAGTAFLRKGEGEWQKVDSGTDKRLFSVSANANGLAAAVGEFGTLVLSIDGGQQWNALTLDWLEVGTDGGAEPHLYGVHVSDAGVITMVGEFGLVLRSEDQGQNWQVVSKATASLFAIEIRSDGRGFAVGQDGYAVKTFDGGKTWDCLNLGSKAILNGVHSAPNGEVVVTAMREMMISRDGGETWRALDDAEVTTLWYVGVSGTEDSVLAVGQGGRILRVGI